MTDEKLYVLVRDDLSAGQQAVQAMHALADFAGDYPEHFHPWNRGSNTLVLLSTSVENMVAVADWADSRDICNTTFQEPDMGNERTAAAFQPHEILPTVFWGYPLALAPKKSWWKRWR